MGELERSLSVMKDQQSVLKQQLRQENAEKHELKQEIDKDQKRIIELERQLQEQRLASEIRFLEFCNDKGDLKMLVILYVKYFKLHLPFEFVDGTPRASELEHKWRWLVAEEERLVELRSAITWRSEELEERQNILDEREIALGKSKNQSENDKSQTCTSADAWNKRKKDLEPNDKVGT